MANLDFTEDRLREILKVLSEAMQTDCIPLDGFYYKPCGYKTGNTLPEIDGSFREFGRFERWAGQIDAHAWFYKKIEIPENMRGKNVELCVSTQLAGWDSINPQFIVYVDGKLVQGLDTNHREVFLDNAKASYEVYIYAYSGKNECCLEFNASLKTFDEAVRKLYYNLHVPYEILLYLQPDEKKYIDIEKHLTAAVNLLDLCEIPSAAFSAGVLAAQNYLDTEFYGKFCKAEEVNAVCIGHTHIDVAWLWTLQQTREKVLRSFSTVLALMKRYPEYKFMSSQPQLYKYLKEESPELYAEVKEMVAQGRWEPEGAMWVEADCNVTGGESLVRQILYGKRFFREEFGKDSRVLWLPDVFGYSAALPQILRKSGVDKFVTSKIGWNETNRMPYDTFWWEGIDGTEVFTYFMTAQDKRRGVPTATNVTYNSKITPDHLQGAYDRYQQKDINHEVMVTFGHGDGGGGPERRDLEYYDILKKGVTGVPKAKMEFSGDFLERVMQRTAKAKNMPRWTGELYLEYHRGTYTSMAQNKRYNRKSEFAYEKAETLSLMNEELTGAEYPQADLQSGWETILLNQFHDIIPGSSIKEVYEVSKQQYEEIGAKAQDMQEKAYRDIAENLHTDGGILVFNPNSFAGSGTVGVDGRQVYVSDIPAKGYKVVKEYAITDKSRVSPTEMENDFFKITLDSRGTFTSLWDKRANREVLRGGQRGNVLTAYEDIPRKYDNWEISNYYTEKSWEVDEVIGMEPVTDGARKGIKITKKFLSSIIKQTVWLYDDIDRIDFDTYIDWKEKHIVLKTAFPVDVNANKAVYEIQFGSVERPTHKNTSWDAAKFEVCAHKFADLSEYGYGVSLLNDCKYGYDIHDGVMRLTLLKCGTYPNPDADKCEHRFVYSLFPHSGDFREAGTVQRAYELNLPMTAMRVGKTNGILPESYSLVSVNAPNVMIETVKKAEDGDGTIVRLYECFNKRTNTELTFGFDAKRACICDLLENDETELPIVNHKVTLSVKPFEIVTLKLRK